MIFRPLHIRLAREQTSTGRGSTKDASTEPAPDRRSPGSQPAKEKGTACAVPCRRLTAGRRSLLRRFRAGSRPLSLWPLLRPFLPHFLPFLPLLGGQHGLDLLRDLLPSVPAVVLFSTSRHTADSPVETRARTQWLRGPPARQAMGQPRARQATSL